MPIKASRVISESLRQRFRAARSVFVLTGAGVSAESGVPTFRGGGRETVWKGMPFSVISSAAMVERDLPAVWEWFDFRRDALQKLNPNPAHEALARWQSRFENFTLVTQNIDGLHKAAGSDDVLELHGNIWQARCAKCEKREDLRSLRDDIRPPVCQRCGGAMRPDVVLFGEMLPPGVFEEASVRASLCDVYFVIGTSAIVYPAAALPEIARAAGAFVVEINPELTPLSAMCDEVIQGKAGEVLPLFEI
ncbi:MAG: SIR2 family NAD-dependent protein deacylase [Pyrinomonadaceae bacterium]